MKRLFALTYYILLICLFSGCMEEKPLFSDYKEYVSNVYLYTKEVSVGGDSTESKDDAAVKEVKVPVEGIEGFVPIYDYQLSYADRFFGDYAYVSADGNNYLIDIGGKLHILPTINSTMSDIIADTLRFENNYIIAKNTFGYGVLDPFGEIIAPFKYDNVQSAGRALLCKHGNEYDLYFDNKLLHTIKSNVLITLLNDEFINKNGKVYKIEDLEIAKINNYNVSDAPACEMVKITNGTRYGYAKYPSGEIVIEPIYVTASAFSDGIAVVANKSEETFMSHYKLIDVNGRELFDFASLNLGLPQDFMVFEHHDFFSVYKTKDSYGAIKLNNNALAENVILPVVPKNMRVYGEYVIDKELKKFYSLSEEILINKQFLEIEPFLNFFIVQNLDETYSILNQNLEIIILNCESIEAYNNTIKIKKNGLFSLYKVEE